MPRRHSPADSNRGGPGRQYHYSQLVVQEVPLHGSTQESRNEEEEFKENDYCEEEINEEKINYMIMEMPKELDKAPGFKGVDQNGKEVSLYDFRGKKLVLYFYPEDDTPTCTIQACNLRDNYSALKANGFEIVGVSPDGPTSHKKFESKFNLPFTLIADPKHKILEKYGVWGEKQMFGNKYMGVHRTTFIIDERGVIQKIFLRPKNNDHSAEILAVEFTV